MPSAWRKAAVKSRLTNDDPAVGSQAREEPSAAQGAEPLGGQGNDLPHAKTCPLFVFRRTSSSWMGLRTIRSITPCACLARWE